MDLLARFVCSWMVSVIYIEVGVEGVAYDGTCTGTGVGNCADTNNKCDVTSHKCACNPTSYLKDGTTECADKVAALDGACDASDSASDQCAVADSECRNDGTDKCLCKATHYVNGAACTIRVAYDGTCSAKGDCAEANNVCTSSKCACSTDSFRKDGTACATKVAALDGPCVATDPASDQCAVAHSECRTNGTDKCLCKATHYTAKGACITRKNPKATCGGDECITHASCVSTKCVCDVGYTPLPTTSPTMCSGVVKITNLPYMYVIPILVSVMFLLRSSVNVYS